jgi:hypothetical protein
MGIKPEHLLALLVLLQCKQIETCGSDEEYRKLQEAIELVDQLTFY